MPRVSQALPLDDALLSKAECGALCKVEKDRWPAYAQRFPALRRALRVVQVNPEGRGVDRWLKSAVIEHMHRELAHSKDELRARGPSVGEAVSA
jgi:hypothetical protein